MEIINQITNYVGIIIDTLLNAITFIFSLPVILIKVIRLLPSEIQLYLIPTITILIGILVWKLVKK